MVLDIENGAFSDYITTAFENKLCRGGEGDICRALNFKLGIPTGIKNKIKEKTELSDSAEAYVISVGKKTTVYAKSEKAFIFATATLLQLCELDELCEGLIYDYQYRSRRDVYHR